MKISGVYAFTSPSGGQYVGSAVNLARRRSQHLWALRRGRHRNPALQKAFNKYGERKRFGVSQSLISLVQLGKSWAHVVDKARP